MGKIASKRRRWTLLDNQLSDGVVAVAEPFTSMQQPFQKAQTPLDQCGAAIPFPEPGKTKMATGGRAQIIFKLGMAFNPTVRMKEKIRLGIGTPAHLNGVHIIWR